MKKIKIILQSVSHYQEIKYMIKSIIQNNMYNINIICNYNNKQIFYNMLFKYKIII